MHRGRPAREDDDDDDDETKQTPCFDAHAPRKTYEAPCFKQTNGLEPAEPG